MLVKKINLILIIAASVSFLGMTPNEEVKFELDIISLEGLEQSFKVRIVNENNEDPQLTDVQYTDHTTPYHVILEDGDYTIALENLSNGGIESKVKRVVEGKVRSEVTSDDRRVRFHLYADGRLSASGLGK